jgi:hypothetical protein
MRLKTASLLVMPAVLASVATLFWHASASSASNSAAAKQPVIVELFTSEGCSDCPPADTLLKRLAEEQPIDGVEIIALEEHVDYWNRQGWNDPFSAVDFSVRQNDYTAVFPKAGGPYTPQMIVDGRAQFIGSRANEALEQIRAAAAQPKAHLLLTLAPASKPHTYNVDLRFDPDSAAPDASSLDFYLAVTEKGLHSTPNAGENSGAALTHAPVVRQLRKLHSIKLPLTASVSNTISLKDNWNASNVTVVAFLVNPKTHQIQAAGESLLPN